MVRVRARGSGRYVLSGWPAVLKRDALWIENLYEENSYWVGTKLTALSVLNSIFGPQPVNHRKIREFRDRRFV